MTVNDSPTKRFSALVHRFEVVFFILALLFFVISFFSIGTSAVTILRAFLYMPFGLLLPGYLLARCLVSRDNASELYGFSLLFGIGIAIACFFLDARLVLPVFPNRFFCLFCGPLLSIPAVVFLAKDVKSGKLTRKAFVPETGELLLIAFSMCLAFASSALQSGIPATRSGISNAYHDTLWIISNTASLSHGWPADNMQYLGKALNSNIFASIFRVSLSRFIGSTAAETMFVFSSLFYVPLLVFSLDALASNYLEGGKTQAHFYTATILFVGYISRAILYFYDFSKAYTAVQYAYICIVLDNLLYLPNGIDLAVPACALLALIIIKIYRSKKIKASYLIAAFAASAILSGAKYIFTVCLICVLIASALLEIILRRGWTSVKQISVITLVVSLAFSLSYIFVVSGGEIYLPASNASPEFYRKDDPEYLEAKKAFLGELDRKDYQYILIFSGDDTQPIVRQDDDAIYYIGAADIRGESIDEHEALRLLEESDIETGGLLSGAGGTVEKEPSSYLRITQSFGFVRLSDGKSNTYKYCFYGREMNLTSIVSLNKKCEPLFALSSDGTEYAYQENYASVNINAASKPTEVFRWLFETNPKPNEALLPIYLFLFIPVFFVLARPVTSIPFLAWTSGKIKRFKDVTLTEMLLCGMALCGLIAVFFLDINGFSQAYFFITAAIFVDLIGIRWLFENYRSIKKPVRIILWVLVAVALATNVLSLSYQSLKGVRQVYYVISQNHIEDGPDDDFINNYEMKAMEWLRTNTPENSVVAYNRYTKTEDYNSSEHPRPNDYSVRYYYYTAYSERQAFLGAWAYMPRTQEMQEMLEERKAVNDALFSPFCSNRRELMERNGISYLVASVYNGRGVNLQDPDLEVVFQNRDIVIYQLKNSM